MQADIERRIREEARFIIRTGATVRTCANVFGVSKTTVHKDMRIRLKHICPALAKAAGQVLDKNLRERHIRGGMATRQKYCAQKQAR